jgi:hypothetical protein
MAPKKKVEKEVEATEVLPVPVETTELVAPQEYHGKLQNFVQLREDMGLPKEATVSLIKAFDVNQKVDSTILQQAKLPEDARRKLIQGKGNVPPGLLPKFDAFVAMHRVPYNNVVNIEGTPYIDVGGFRLKTQGDFRCWRSAEIIEEEQGYVENPALPTGGMWWARCKWRGIFWNGESYTGLGAADSLELGKKRPGGIATYMDVIQMARTRGERNLYRTASGIPVPAAEDITEDVITIIPAEVKEPTPQMPTSPENKVQFISMALAKFPGVDVKSIIKALDIESIDEIEDFGQAWSKLEEKLTQ